MGYVPYSTATYIRMYKSGTVISASGDSGGPIYIVDTALGLNAAGNYYNGYGYATYMPIDYIDDFGAYMVTGN